MCKIKSKFSNFKFSNSMFFSLFFNMVNNKKRKHHNNDDELKTIHEYHHCTHRYFQFLFLLYFCVSTVIETSRQYLGFKGNKRPELCRVRKEIERDIFVPLGSYMFRRAYRMKKSSFYSLHSTLKPDLDRVFFPNGGGKRNPNKNPYLIDTKI